MNRNSIAAQMGESQHRDGADLSRTEMAALADKYREGMWTNALTSEYRARAFQSIADSRAVLKVAGVFFAVALVLFIAGGVTLLLPRTFPPDMGGVFMPIAVVACGLGTPFGAVGILLAWTAANRLNRVFRAMWPERNGGTPDWDTQGAM